jgi:hypothetical protein
MEAIFGKCYIMLLKLFTPISGKINRILVCAFITDGAFVSSNMHENFVSGAHNRTIPFLIEHKIAKGAFCRLPRVHGFHVSLNINTFFTQSRHSVLLYPYFICSHPKNPNDRHYCQDCFQNYMCKGKGLDYYSVTLLKGQAISDLWDTFCFHTMYLPTPTTMDRNR